MRRVAVLLVLAVVFGVCSQSFGYILAYNIAGQVKAVDTQTNAMSRTMVWGTLIMDIDEDQGIATEATLILHNRNRNGQGVYEVSNDVALRVDGNSVAVVIDTGAFGGQIIMTGNVGRMWGRNIGLADRKNVASMMDGSIHFNGGILFNADESLIGAGMMSAVLDLQTTRNANRNGSMVGDVVDNIITSLLNRGFTELAGGNDEPLPG